jgi:hypothetical protein
MGYRISREFVRRRVVQNTNTRSKSVTALMASTTARLILNTTTNTASPRWKMHQICRWRISNFSDFKKAPLGAFFVSRYLLKKRCIYRKKYVQRFFVPQ